MRNRISQDRSQSEECQEPGAALTNNLLEQAQQYQYYGEKLKEQRQALLHGNLVDLAEVNIRIDTVVSELLRLEVDREGLVRIDMEMLGIAKPFQEAWFSRASLPELPIKCEELATHLSRVQAQNLREAREILRDRIQAINRDVQVNAALAQNGQKLIATTMASLTTLAGDRTKDRMHTYSQQGQSLYASGRRQVRNLLNRSA